ncbi:uncharacterized protein DSM5745_07599 [Aspergillus mulundensis]|uniref:C2 domain-containing protein n=1 Tax=Aspergillus mulundensis TaxID=1810919 RepID=A0A3D8RED8_9EURO|nr:hypothetical protein DSM5745_07599 [Aspergillus mulundensis]RDW72427.1 hypothetical protein DSM5745_07599 [Aspergillus mulundensis]
MAVRMSSVHHAAGIFADMSVDGPAIGTLVAVVDRAKNLPNRKTMGKQNPYCAARLGKEAQKTGTDVRGGQTPKWDQELRFTVHESPDYFRMKLSVFNDDKRTDLIGETWIDLQDLIIPGGSQSDQWHTLQFRGKYAGEIRLEMTYYDTRPEDEAVIERRTQGTERAKTSSSSRSAPAPAVPSPAPSPSSSSSLSGPRQLKEVKRRPVPTEHTGGPRPVPDKAYSTPAPLPVSHPSRAPYDGIPTPPSSSGMDYAHQPRHSVPQIPYDAVPRPRTYETPDDFGREWAAPPHHPPAGRGQPRYQEHYPPRAEQEYYARPRSGYDNAPPADYRSMRQLPAARPDQYYEDMHVEAARPTSRHYSQIPPDAYSYGSEDIQTRYQHASSSMSSRHRIEYPQESEPYRQHNSLPRRGRSPGRYHAEYAAMQPRVEDEVEEGAPPPPPVHRTAMAHPSPQLVPSPAPSYKAYSPEYGPRSTHDMNIPQPTELMLDLPSATSPSSMPPSLVAGLDPVVAEAESERVVREIRRRSGIFEEDLPRHNRSRDPSPSPISPPYPENVPTEDLRRSLVSRRSMNGDVPSQQLVLRKSISPRPPPSRGRGGSRASITQTPFSPDSFDSFNPHAARSAVNKDPLPAYSTPAEAMEVARRTEAAAARPDGPIIGDDGREIDPSDHLPTDTWAPEPERKTRKPGVIVRFKNAPTRRSPVAPRPTSSYMVSTDVERGRPGYGGGSPGGPGHARTYSTPSPNPMPRRHSISPAPSPMYAPAPIGPPIPAKVPIGAPAGVQDALSRELNSIDIGSVGVSSSRAMRKYVPRPTYAM